MPDASFYFKEKQIVAVSVADAYLEGLAEAITYSDCEVYAASGILTDVWLRDIHYRSSVSAFL